MDFFNSSAKQMRTLSKSYVWLVLAGLGSACSCGAPGVASCESNADCPRGEACVEGLCKPPPGLDGGRYDGGTRSDAGHVADAGHEDAGTRDGGARDAGVEDAGSLDAGEVDAGQTSGVAITCSELATNYQMNGGSCGSERWSVKTGTDNDATNVNMTPQMTTIGQLASLPVPANQSSSCTRNAPTETQVWELKNVNLRFHSKESDSDYHIVASDGTGATMIVEVPWPGCVGSNACTSNAPFLCEITHARAAADRLASTGSTIGTVMGVGFFDFVHGQSGVAPNGIELHPVLALCLGEDCDPLMGY